jgi:hypothetical protein
MSHWIQFLGKPKPEALVEVSRRTQIGHDHADNVEPRHESIVAQARSETLIRAACGAKRALRAGCLMRVLA